MASQNRCFQSVALALSLAAFPATLALAVDGVVEINQVRAVAGGVTVTDGPGFPVTIDQSGSYVLTGDLSVPPSTTGIVINADDVTLDLNGFGVLGSGGEFFSDGIVTSAQRENIEIHNGTVRDFVRHGIFSDSTSRVRVVQVRSSGNLVGSGIELQGDGNLVDGCTTANNGLSGIRVTDSSLVINSVAENNTGFGLTIGLASGYRSNVLTLNNGGNANPQVFGAGIELDTNICGANTICP